MFNTKILGALFIISFSYQSSANSQCEYLQQVNESQKFDDYENQIRTFDLSEMLSATDILLDQKMFKEGEVDRVKPSQLLERIIKKCETDIETFTEAPESYPTLKSLKLSGKSSMQEIVALKELAKEKSINDLILDIEGDKITTNIDPLLLANRTYLTRLQKYVDNSTENESIYSILNNVNDSLIASVDFDYKRLEELEDQVKNTTQYLKERLKNLADLEEGKHDLDSLKRIYNKLSLVEVDKEYQSYLDLSLDLARANSISCLGHFNYKEELQEHIEKEVSKYSKRCNKASNEARHLTNLLKMDEYRNEIKMAKREIVQKIRNLELAKYKDIESSTFTLLVDSIDFDFNTIRVFRVDGVSERVTFSRYGDFIGFKFYNKHYIMDINDFNWVSFSTENLELMKNELICIENADTGAKVRSNLIDALEVAQNGGQHVWIAAAAIGETLFEAKNYVMNKYQGKPNDDTFQYGYTKFVKKISDEQLAITSKLKANAQKDIQDKQKHRVKDYALANLPLHFSEAILDYASEYKRRTEAVSAELMNFFEDQKCGVQSPIIDVNNTSKNVDFKNQLIPDQKNAQPSVIAK